MDEEEKSLPLSAPLVNGASFREIAGISETQLRYYREAGIIESFDDGGGSPLSFALDQVTISRLVDSLRRSDTSVPDIAAAASKGPATLIEQARTQCGDAIRQTRRNLKAITSLENSCRAFAKAKGKRGFYLRYLPMRWLAIIPVAGDALALPSADALIEAHRQLEKIVSVVGWAKGLSRGTLLSVSANMKTATRFAYLELSSPPMPLITGTRVVDGGCYGSFAPAGETPSCFPTQCPTCARFGRFTEPGEKQAWRTTDRREPWRREGTVLMKDLSTPYPDGTWESATKQYLGIETAPREQRGSGSPSHATMPGSPQKMPHFHALPLGVTACEIPAGFFLCRTFSGSPEVEFARASQQSFAALLAALRQLPTTGRLEAAPKTRAATGAPSSPPTGPFVEPFAAPRNGGDPAFQDACRSLTKADLATLQLPINSALWPQDGFCILEATQPLQEQPLGLTREFQVLCQPNAALVEKLRA